MEVLHLSYGDGKGAFFGAYRTHLNMKKRGISSKLIVAEKTSHDTDVIEVMSPLKRRLCSFFHRMIRRVIVKRLSRDPSYLIYFTTFSLRKIFKRYRKKPDLIVVYYVAGFLSDKDIKKISEEYGAPVCFYLMDAAPLTGGCHYPWECDGYTKSCSNCPAVKVKVLPWLIFFRRKKIYSSMDCFYLSLSNWTDEKCDATGLAMTLPRKKIRLGIDGLLFTPRSKEDVKNKLSVNLDSNSRVFLLGSQSIIEKRKGFELFFEAINIILKDNINKLDDVTFLTVGDNNSSKFFDDLGLKNVSIPFIKDKDLYPMIYNLADFFICSSIEDAGPMMINESMLSGTPVISFPVGVASDLIFDGENGYLCDNVSSKALAEKIVNALNVGKSGLDNMRNHSRKSALLLTSSDYQIEEFEKMILAINKEKHERKASQQDF